MNTTTAANLRQNALDDANNARIAADHALFECDFGGYAKACADRIDAERRYEDMISEGV
jgi:hypothetical protein